MCEKNQDSIGKKLWGVPGQENSSFISYRIDDLHGERLNDVMVEVAGGVIIKVFEEKIELNGVKQ